MAGALHALAQVPVVAPLPAGALQVLALALLVALLARVGSGPAALRQAGWLGALFGTAWLVGSFWWLFISMHRYGLMPAPLAAAAVLALALALSGFLVIACVLWVHGRRSHAGADALRWAGLWLAVELARGQVFTGFPWGAAGYAHADGLLAGLAPWLGVYGIGAVAALLAAGVALAGQGALTDAVGTWLEGSARHDHPTGWRGWIAPGLLLLVPALPAPPAVDFTRPTGELSVTLLQGNIPQDQKFAVDHLPAALDWHARALLASRSDLVLAPETAVPLLPGQLPPGYWDALQQGFARSGRQALIGIPLGDLAHGYTNSAIGLGPAPTPYRYDKHHLVPFGEFVPWGFRWFVDLMRMPLGDFSRGPLAAASLPVKGERIGPNICYEDLFGEELAARFRDPATAPTILANLSNIGWFGESVAVDQHLQISRLRTLELQRPMLRATNTGATVVIDHLGRVRHRLDPHRAGVLEGRVQGRDGITPFARWAAWAGLWPLWAVALLMALLSGHAAGTGCAVVSTGSTQRGHGRFSGDGSQ